MGNASASKHDAAMHWANENPASARTVALQELWRTFTGKDTTVGNEHDRLYAAMAWGYDAHNAAKDTEIAAVREDEKLSTARAEAATRLLANAEAASIDLSWLESREYYEYKPHKALADLLAVIAAYRPTVQDARGD